MQRWRRARIMCEPAWFWVRLTQTRWACALSCRLRYRRRFWAAREGMFGSMPWPPRWVHHTAIGINGRWRRNEDCWRLWGSSGRGGRHRGGLVSHKRLTMSGCQDGKYRVSTNRRYRQLRNMTALQDRCLLISKLLGSEREIEDTWRKLGSGVDPDWDQRARLHWWFCRLGNALRAHMRTNSTSQKHPCGTL